MNIRLFLLSIFFCGQALGSGCYTEFMEGTNPKSAIFPHTSVLMMASSALTLYSERNLDQNNEEKRNHVEIGLAIPLVFYYFWLHFKCRTISKDEYLRKDQKGEAKDSHIYLAKIGTRSDIEDTIKRWKRLQRFGAVLWGGTNLYYQIRTADLAETKGLEVFSIANIVVMLGLSLWDVDNIWNSKVPRGIDLNLFPIKTAHNKWELAPHLTVRF